MIAAQSEVTMLSRMMRAYRLTFAARANGDLQLTTYDERLDTSAVYECERALGASALIVRAYNDFRAEYE